MTGGGQAAKKVCRRSTADEGQRASTSSVIPTTTADHATGFDRFLNDLSDDGDSLTDVFDMSWSTILGRSLSCPADADHDAQSDAELRQQRVDVAASSARPAADNDAELHELIRACADTDAGMLDDLGDFGLDMADGDSLDLTIYGVGLRPPDWWASLGDGFDAASVSTTSDATAQRQNLNTPSPGPVTHDEQEQQQQPHPWAENRGSMTLPSLDSSLDAFGLLLGDPPTAFDSDVADDF